MRPSSASSFDPNAPYREAIASLVDCNFFADEGAGQPEIVADSSQQTPLRGLSPRRIAQSNRSTTIPEVGTSTASQVTVSTIQQYLLVRGYDSNSFLLETTMQSRLNEGKLSAETLLIALQTVHEADHPLFAALGMRNAEKSLIITKLSGIITHRNGFPKSLRRITQNCNNNPDQLIAYVLQYVRNP